MNQTLLKIIAAVPGVPLLVNGLGYAVLPQQTAAGLGMPLLDGMARSSQIGDGGAFFFCSAVFIFYGAIRSEGRWLQAAAFLVGSVAVFRTIAWLAHGAELATQFIAIEVVMAIWLLVCARLGAAAR